MTLFVDASLVMYAVGGHHPMQQPCVRILDRISSGELDAVVSAEVIQEIVHRYISIKQPETAARVARLTMDMFAPVLPITHAVVRRLPELAERYPTLQARDLMHVATCIHEGITEMVSPDTGFDQVSELRRHDPAEFASTLS